MSSLFELHLFADILIHIDNGNRDSGTHFQNHKIKGAPKIHFKPNANTHLAQNHENAIDDKSDMPY